MRRDVYAEEEFEELEEYDDDFETTGTLALTVSIPSPSPSSGARALTISQDDLGTLRASFQELWPVRCHTCKC